MEIVRLEKISFAYPGGPAVFEGLDFSLGQAQRIGITGPNGSGKSTLFQLATGLLKPDSGRVLGLGSELRKESDFKHLRAKLGYLFQDSDDQLFCPTVLEEVAFGPLNLGVGRHEAVEIVKQTLESIGLPGFEQRVTYRLSGGEKRLVALASVLAMRPLALLLDEPTNGLDDEHARKFKDVLLNSGLGFAVISHDKALLREVCAQTFRLEKSGLVQA